MGEWIICLTCGKTVATVNSDGECMECEQEAESNGNRPEAFNLDS